MVAHLRQTLSCVFRGVSKQTRTQYNSRPPIRSWYLAIDNGGYLCMNSVHINYGLGESREGIQLNTYAREYNTKCCEQTDIYVIALYV